MGNEIKVRAWAGPLPKLNHLSGEPLVRGTPKIIYGIYKESGFIETRDINTIVKEIYRRYSEDNEVIISFTDSEVYLNGSIEVKGNLSKLEEWILSKIEEGINHPEGLNQFI